MGWMDDFDGADRQFPYPDTLDPLPDWDDLTIGDNAKAQVRGTLAVLNMRAGSAKEGSGRVFNLHIKAVDTQPEYTGQAELALWVDPDKVAKKDSFKDRKNLALVVRIASGCGLIKESDYTNGEPTAETVFNLQRDISSSNFQPYEFEGTIFWKRTKFEGSDGKTVEYETSGLYVPKVKSFKEATPF